MWLILDGLSYVVRSDALRVRQIRNGARHFQYPVHLIGAEVQLLDGGFEQLPRGILHHTARLNLHRSDLGITGDAIATQSLHLTQTGLFDPVPDRGRSLSLTGVHEHTSLHT